MANCVALSGLQNNNKKKTWMWERDLGKVGVDVGGRQEQEGGKINHNALCICMKFLNNKFNLKSIASGFGEVSQQIRAFAALAEDLGLVATCFLATNNFL